MPLEYTHAGMRPACIREIFVEGSGTFRKIKMKFVRTSLETCGTATGTVVVIDVIRAFSTAAYAFAAGAREIVLVGSVEEALALKRQMPGALAMGEVGGLPVKEFDFGNSPVALSSLDLTGRRLIQRTSAGTQGVVRSRQADHLLASSFCCASATARAIRKLAPGTLTFVITGLRPGGYGDEDAACADYIEAMLSGGQVDAAPFVERVYASPTGRIFADPAQPEFPIADLEYCTQVDRFDFAMPVRRREGLFVMESVK
jgi:2-phosphosulfolactate phosphatase